MSRAFVREDGPDITPLPDLPVSPHPNLVTPRGLSLLRDRLAAAQSELLRLRALPDRLDRLPEAAAERDIRYLDARLRTAILTDPATAPPNEAAFGRPVSVRLADGRTRRLEIVGEDEAAPASGTITPYSPLGRALIGARVGDIVACQKPGGIEELEVISVG